MKVKAMVCAGESVELNGVPEVIKLVPMGHVISTKGDFDVDEGSVRDIIQHFKDRKLDLVIDYEHQTLHDVQAPAAGWVKDIYQEGNAIVGKVEWTPKGREYVANKEYRYLSPVLLVRKSDNKAAVLHSVALTNTPAINGMFPIANSDGLGDYVIEGEEEKENMMELNKLIKLLGLPETATEEDVTGKITELLSALEAKKGEEGKKEDGTELVANKLILDLLGLPADAKTADVTAQIMACKAGDAALQERVKQLEAAQKQRNADDLVEMAMKAGKISAAQKEWANSYALSDPKGFKTFAEKAPVVVPVGKLTYADDQKKKDGLSETDMKILKDLGISKEDAEKYGGIKHE